MFFKLSLEMVYFPINKLVKMFEEKNYIILVLLSYNTTYNI